MEASPGGTVWDRHPGIPIFRSILQPPADSFPALRFLPVDLLDDKEQTPTWGNFSGRRYVGLVHYFRISNCTDCWGHRHLFSKHQRISPSYSLVDPGRFNSWYSSRNLWLEHFPHNSSSRIPIFIKLPGATFGWHHQHRHPTPGSPVGNYLQQLPRFVFPFPLPVARDSGILVLVEVWQASPGLVAEHLGCTFLHPV